MIEAGRIAGDSYDLATIDQALSGLNAWRQIHPGGSSDRFDFEVLKPKNRKSAVYRFLRVGPHGRNVIAKRCRRTTAEVEERIYRLLLATLDVSAPVLYGVAINPHRPFAWMFLEDAPGDVFEITDPDHRKAAARWLAALHSAPVADRLRAGLPDRGAGHYLDVLDVAHGVLRDALRNPVLVAEERAVFGDLDQNCERLKLRRATIREMCSSLPPAVVHGDMGSKNLRVARRADELVFVPFDWETAGWGCPAMDLTISDPTTYRAAMADRGSDLDGGVLQQAMWLGQVFWCLAAIRGEASSLNAGSVTRVMHKMRFYQTQVASAMVEAGWVD
jgi:hypothetical protein